MPDELHEQVAHHDQHGAGRVPAQHPDGAQRPDGQQRRGHPGDQDVPPLRQGRRHRVRGRRDRHQLEDRPAEALQDVQHGGQIGQPGPEQPAQQDHGRRAGPRARQPSERERRRAEQGADHDRGQRRGEGKLRGTRAAGLQHEDRPGETEQAHPEVAPQPELVEQAQRLRHRLGQRARDLRMAVARDGDEGVFGVGGGRCHGGLPTPALPGQVQTVGGAAGQPPSQPGQPELPCVCSSPGCYQRPSARSSGGARP